MRHIYLLFFVLFLLPGFSLAVTLPDGYYNIIESELQSSETVFHDELEGQKSITFFSPETVAYQFKYDSANKTVEFNNGGSNDWEYEHELWTNLSIDSVTPTIEFFIETSVDLITATAVMDASYTQMSNLYLWTGTNTETFDGETEVKNFSNMPVMLTADADLSVFAELEIETDTKQFSAEDFQTTNPVNADETNVDLVLELGLKQGAANLSLADINGQYHFSVRGFSDSCRSISNNSCTEVVQEAWAEIVTFDFNGSGACTPILEIGTDFAVQRMTSDVTNSPLYVQSYAGIVSCSYSVTGTDTLQITTIYNDGSGSETDISHYKVSAGHRYMVGVDPYTTTSLTGFDRGTIFGMRKDTNLASADFSGTYLGQYQGVIYDNTDDTATDVTTIKHVNRAFAITFDGLSGCSYKEYKTIATAHQYPVTDTGEVLTSNSVYEAACGGGYSIVTDGAHQYVQVVIIPGELVMNGYLSDNGETISFFKPEAKNLAVNDGLNGNLPKDDYASTATIIELLNGVAIKYAGDEQSTAAAIAAWLNVPAGSIDKTGVVVDFDSQYGLWSYANTGTWSQMHSATSSYMRSADLDANGQIDVIVDFGTPFGIWIYYNMNTWTQLHSTTSETIQVADIDGNHQQDIIIDFGDGIGLWAWMNGGSWLKLHGFSPAPHISETNLDGDSEIELIVDFGASYGLWIYDDGHWSKLHGFTANHMTSGDIDGNNIGDVIIDFGPSLGLWVWMNNSSWVKIHGFTSKHIITADIDNSGKSDVIVDFGSQFGLWVWLNNSSWVQLHGLTSEQIVARYVDGDNQIDLVIDFAAAGLWARMNNATWLQLHNLNPKLIGH